MPYFAPGQPDYNYLRHLFLLCWDYQSPLDLDALRYYVTHVGEDGVEQGWLFDSFLSFVGRAPSGNSIHNDINLGVSMSGEGDFFAVPSPNPAMRTDWETMLDSQFSPGGMWPMLDEAVAEAARKLGPPPHPRNVVVTIPYPHPNQSCFDPDMPLGKRRNFSVIGQNLTQASLQRLEACKWFVDETVRRWEEARPRHLHLLGFYWTYESLHYSWDVDDHWVLKELYKYIRSRGYRFFWIPFYSSFNVNMLAVGRGFYFDCGFLQPNHMFYENLTGVDRAAMEAKERGAGIEMEYYMLLEENTKVGSERHRRLRNYLDGGVTHGYMTESACAYFCGFNDFHRLARHEDAAERRCYQEMCRFVRGIYQHSGQESAV